MKVEDLLGVEHTSVRAALELIEQTTQNHKEQTVNHLTQPEQIELVKGLCAAFCLWAAQRIGNGSLSNFFKDLRLEAVFFSSHLGQDRTDRKRVLDLLNCTSGYGASFYMQLDALKGEALTNTIYDLISLFQTCSRHSYGGTQADNTREACNRIRVYMAKSSRAAEPNNEAEIYG